MSSILDNWAYVGGCGHLNYQTARLVHLSHCEQADPREEYFSPIQFSSQKRVGELETPTADGSLYASTRRSR